MNKIDDPQGEIHNCEEMAAKPVNFFFQEGSTRKGKKILIVGESLAKNGWVESGKAFYTTEGKLVPTGKRLNEELVVLGIALEECAFTEIAKCYIGKNRKQLATCGLRCAEHFRKQLEHFDPRIIVPLGVITKDVINTIFNAELTMGEMGKIVSGKASYAVLPLFHPSPASPYGHGKNMVIIEAQSRKIQDLIKG